MTSWPPGGSRLVGKMGAVGQQVVGCPGLISNSWQYAFSPSSAIYVVGVAFFDSDSEDGRTAPPLVAVGTGDAGAEVTIATAVILTGSMIDSPSIDYRAGSATFAIPLTVAAGTKLSLRSSVTSTVGGTGLIFYVPASSVEGN